MRIIILALLFLTSCGFQPVYGTNSNLKSMGQVEISEISGRREAQKLRSKLIDQFQYNDGAKRYKLQVNLNTDRTDLAITRNREITRYNMRLTAPFTLIDKRTGKTVTSGQSTITSSFDAAQSDYATLAAERDAIMRGVEELARDIHIKVSSHFLQSP